MMGDARWDWALTLSLSVAICISYVDRANLSHAMLRMAAELGIDAAAQGVAFGAFSAGYVAFMIPAGLLVDRFGAGRMAAASVAGWSLVTAVTALSGGAASLIASRFVLGMAEAPIFPAAAVLIRTHLPTHLRGRATAVFDGGSYVGTAVAAPLVVYSMLWLGWRVSFLFCAALGFAWVAGWLRTDWVRPSTAKGASPATSAVLPFLRSRKVLGVGLGFLCYNYVKSFFLTWFPTYLVTDRHVTVAAVGILAVIPPMAALLGEAAGGVTTDNLVRRTGDLTKARKVPLCLGLLGSASLALTPFCGPHWLAVAVLSFAFASLIACSPAIWALPGDLAPNIDSVGTLGGIQNAIANIGGIVSPILTGLLLSRYGDFTVALAATGVVSVIGTLSFGLILDKVEPIPVTDRHVAPAAY